MPTERRLYKLSQVIHQRQMDVVIALDHIHDQHNLSAVVRSADAAGFGRIIWTPDFKMTEKINPEISRGAERWVDLKVYEDLKPELLKLKSEGYRIVATHMARKAVDFRSVDWTKPSVVIFGNEHRGKLGKNGRGLTEFLEPVENKNRYGLGYIPSKEDKKRILAEKREKRQARLENRDINDRRVPLCHISKSFRSAGFEFQEAMAVTEETNPLERSQVELVRVCPSGTELENWDTVDLPVTFISALK